MTRFSQGEHDNFFLPHGGRLTKAYRFFPHAPKPFIDLSTGINPYSYPYQIGNIALEALPQPEDEEKLSEAAALAYGVKGKEIGIVSAPGAQILISLLPIVLKSSILVLIEPTYQEYRYAWALHDRPVMGFKTLEEAINILKSTPNITLLLCNPNNPDGTQYKREDIKTCLEIALKNKSYLVIDESFADFETCSATDLLPHPSLIILRSFGKAYGLAGVRLGFVLAAPAMARKIGLQLGPWSVSSLALSIGTQALSDATWRHNMKGILQKSRSRLCQMLLRYGFECRSSPTLFVLAAKENAAMNWWQLAEHGLLVRKFDYNESWLRLGLPKEENEWVRLQQALAVNQNI